MGHQFSVKDSLETYSVIFVSSVCSALIESQFSSTPLPQIPTNLQAGRPSSGATSGGQSYNDIWSKGQKCMDFETA